MKSDLSNLLREWQPDVPEPVSFRRSVWSKIELRPIATSWWERALAAVARPRIAVGLATFAMLTAGISATQMSRTAGEDAYLRSVNPYAMSR